MGTREGPLRTLCVRRGRGSSVSAVRDRKQFHTRAYTVLSLFSGGGGLDLGLYLTGRFRHLGCVEMDPASCRTLRVNRDAGGLADADLAVHEADISKLEPVQVLAEHGLRPGELDVIVGGPPCQAFSQIGKQRGLDDPRGLLLWDFVRFVRACRPRCFLLENVKGLLAMPLRPGMQKGTLMRSLLGRFRRAGYTVDVSVLDAADHGVAQHRERVVLVGNRCGGRFQFPHRTHGRNLLPPRTLRNALAGLADADPKVLRFSQVASDILEAVRPGCCSKPLAALTRSASRRSLRRLSWDRPCPTILTNPIQTQTTLCHPDETRPLSVRECGRAQGFPDEWLFCGSTRDQYRQIGNAVPVHLGYLLGHAVGDPLDHIRSRGAATGTRGMDGVRPRQKTGDLVGQAA